MDGIAAYVFFFFSELYIYIYINLDPLKYVVMNIEPHI